MSHLTSRLDDIKRHKSELRTLILEIRFNKIRFERENEMRMRLALQKGYLTQTLQSFKITREAMISVLTRMRLRHIPPGRSQAGKSTTTPAIQKFRHAVHAVIAINRMRSVWCYDSFA